MKFLIDAHLPPSLRFVFQAAGHDAIHTLDLPDQNASREGILNEVSTAEMRIPASRLNQETFRLRQFALMVVETQKAAGFQYGRSGHMHDIARPAGAEGLSVSGNAVGLGEPLMQRHFPAKEQTFPQALLNAALKFIALSKPAECGRAVGILPKSRPNKTGIGIPHH